MIYFLVHPGMSELRKYAQEQGWLQRGFTVLCVSWLELHFTTDGWVTTRVLKSTDVPCPVINGWCYLPHVHSGDAVEFAVHAGVSCRAPDDQAASRDQGSLWFNNDGANYTQTARWDAKPLDLGALRTKRSDWGSTTGHFAKALN